VLDTATGGALLAARAGPSRPRSLRYRSGQALITLRQQAGGSYQVRVAAHGLDVGDRAMPLISASLQVGSATFADSLSCSRRGQRIVCHG